MPDAPAAPPASSSSSDVPDDPGTVSDTEQALDRLALSDWVWTAVEQLPQDMRVTVMLRYFTRHTTAYAGNRGHPGDPRRDGA